MPTKITDIIVRDIRFPTSVSHAGSDPMNPDPDYSAAYVVLKTEAVGSRHEQMTNASQLPPRLESGLVRFARGHKCPF